ncbi:MAG: beta family protein [Burkholderiales bacterium]|jgi:hypothetical protein
MAIKFEDYPYYPAIRSRQAEITGLEKLSTGQKQRILPIITLGKWPKAEDIAVSGEKAAEAMGGLPYLLDVTRESAHHNSSSKNLVDAKDAFRNWQNFVANFEHAIPVVQFSDDARVRDITNQAKAFEENIGRLAFRIANYEEDTPRVISALAALDSPESALIIVDLGYIRPIVPMATSVAIKTINELRDEIPEAIITIISTSFPQSVTAFSEDSSGVRGAIDILERELFQAIGGSDVCIYGDHASIHAVVYPDIGGRYVPRIDLPLDDVWYFERRPGAGSEGYIEAAKAIIAAHPHVTEGSDWGAEMIRDAAAGSIGGMGSASKWIAVRVNLHLATQLELSEALASGNSEEENEEDF